MKFNRRIDLLLPVALFVAIERLASGRMAGAAAVESSAGGSRSMELKEEAEKLFDKLLATRAELSGQTPLEPQETLALLKQLEGIHSEQEKELAKEAAEPSKGDESDGEDGGKKPAAKLKWFKRVAILLELSKSSKDKCNKESVFDQHAALAYYKSKPQMRAFVEWCMAEQFAVCEPEMAPAFRRKVETELSEEQRNELQFLVEGLADEPEAEAEESLDSAAREAQDADRHVDAMASYYQRKGLVKEISNKRKFEQTIASTLGQLCEQVKQKLSPEAQIFKTLAPVRPVVQRMDEFSRKWTTIVQACGEISYSIGPFGLATHKILAADTSAQPAKGEGPNGVLKYLFNRKKQ